MAAPLANGSLFALAYISPVQHAAIQPTLIVVTETTARALWFAARRGSLGSRFPLPQHPGLRIEQIAQRPLSWPRSG